MRNFLKMAAILMLGIVIGVSVSSISPRLTVKRFLTSLQFQKPNSDTSSRSSSPVRGDQFDLQTYLSEFPEVRSGFRRYVIPAPKNEVGTLWLADILVGRYEMADCNSWVLNSVKSELKKQWLGNRYSYYYYEIETDGNGLNTLIGCPRELKFHTATHENIPKHLSFPRRGNNEYYPIVVDVSSDFEIGYKLWTTSGEPLQAEVVK